mmetsp:Transcript_4285/g.8429  ORF Transcript_4285/g.8429 Transcript_4285/m.8429 type:complete len:373 (+) Transcript_4285:1446-2564(+)
MNIKDSWKISSGLYPHDTRNSSKIISCASENAPLKAQEVVSQPLHRQPTPSLPKSVSGVMRGLLTTASHEAAWYGLRLARRFATGSARSSMPEKSTLLPSGSDPGGWDWLDAVFYLTPSAITLGLGSWQLYRYQWKKELIEERKLRMESPVTHDEARMHLLAQEYQPVSMDGSYISGRQMLVGPRSAPASISPKVVHWGGSMGWYVVTPFITTDSTLVLVNRGWIPCRVEKVIDEPAKGLTTIMALVRQDDQGNRFTPANKPQANEWYSIRREQMAQHVIPDHSDPVLVVDLVRASEEADSNPTTGTATGIPDQEFPMTKNLDDYLTFYVMPSTHLIYAANWFAMFLAMTVMTWMRFRRLGPWRTPVSAGPK